MKLSFLIILTAVVTISCSSSRIYSSQTFNIPETEEGTIFIQSSGLGSNAKKAYENSINNALSTLIFQGIPESVQSRPMVEPSNAEAVKSKVNRCITDNACYKSFITQIYPVGGIQKVSGGYAAVNKVKVNMRSLRSYLEQNNIIRKFGF